ncbi:hypothetical protein MMC20_003661 [Loxospora ochrophaea]|nr:hypothetical protein [Loxospora ochrophaea]
MNAQRAENPSDDGSTAPDFGDSIDAMTFEQILEMDDDEEEREFSKSIVYGFFEQAEVTFQELETTVGERDLKKLSSLGHFLKGSSATLGLTKVKDSCEKIQNYGSHKNAAGADWNADDDTLLNQIKATLAEVRVEYAEVERKLKRFYHDSGA